MSGYAFKLARAENGWEYVIHNPEGVELMAGAMIGKKVEVERRLKTIVSRLNKDYAGGKGRAWKQRNTIFSSERRRRKA